ncbi:hypothetical protein GGX14DRAFT_140714 [Mycena pura]|uniref:Uncharacterized protein n=1 Tax=Mycena pura TaxID=153505 RepID=A0AAD6V750_9AGAR|nr:hypothetical protein GGX14DRAFT_140714 [Mycena pura]
MSMSAPPAASASTTLAPEESAGSSLIRRVSTQKISAFIRSKTQRRAKRSPIIFPPPSWNLEETLNNGAGASETPGESSAPTDSRDHEERAPTDEDVPEPYVLAQRIGTLIDALPPPATISPTDVGAVDPEGPQLPGTVTADSHLMMLLSSAAVMNGSRSLGRQSVWSILEKLRHRHVVAFDGKSNKKEEDEDRNDDHDQEDGGVMVYAPLEPTADSEVELAESEMVLEYLDEPTEQHTSPPAADAKPPLSPRPEAPSTDKRPEMVKHSISWRRRNLKVKEHIHWVPSKTKISLQVLWWGYRLYLPPPVMKKLDSAHLTAAKRGTMLITALKYLLEKIPVMMLPPQIRPALVVLKRLTPYLGYVGVFVTWSWKAIMDHDQGDGVVLLATWLIPVALLPHPLKPEDFRRPGEAVKDAHKDLDGKAAADDSKCNLTGDDEASAEENVRSETVKSVET